MLSDFAVLVAIGIVVGLRMLFFAETFVSNVEMSDSLGWTDTGRDGLLSFFHRFQSVPVAEICFSIVPALLVYILLFIETEITEVLLLKEDRGCRKGGGFHWDLMLCGLLTFICSIFGLPWMCAAAVPSLAHGSSLTVMKKTAPGEKPKIDKVIEQRVTSILVALLIGCCTFCGRLLSKLPTASLFGVFLFLGVTNLIHNDHNDPSNCAIIRTGKVLSHGALL